MMPTNSYERKPDRWYSLTRTGELIKSGYEREAVLSNSAHYYVKLSDSSSYIGRFLFVDDKHSIFNKYFQPTRLEHNGIICKDAMDGFEEEPFTSFTVEDKAGGERALMLDRGIDSYKQAFLIMDELSRFSSWRELELANENKNLKEKVTELETVISELKKQIEDFEKTKAKFGEVLNLLLPNENKII